MQAWVLAFAVLVLPGVSAAGAQLHAETVSWSGARQLTAELLALRYRPEQPQSWQLDAALLHVDLVETDLHVLVPGLAWTDTEPRHVQSDYVNVSLRSESARPDHFLYALPLDADLILGCATGVQPTSSATFQVPDQVQRPNPNPETPSGNALQANSCGSVQLCGTFRIALWSWTATGHHASGQFTLETGRTGPTADSLAPSRAAQAYLDVDNGCLILPPETDAVANSFDLNTPSLLLHQAKGLLDGAPATGLDLQLEGDVEAHLNRSREGTFVQATGIHRASLDSDLTVTTFQASVEDAPVPWAWVSAALLLIAAALAYLQVRRMRLHYAVPAGLSRAKWITARRERRQLLALADKRVPRPYTADEPKQVVKFTGEDRKKVVAAVRAAAILEGKKVPDFLEYIVRLGLQEYLRRKQEK